jgi:methyl coenzyme M reductase subunit C
MQRLQSILYVTPGTKEEGGALEQALRLARSHEAELRAVVMSPARRPSPRCN